MDIVSNSFPNDNVFTLWPSGWVAVAGPESSLYLCSIALLAGSMVGGAIVGMAVGKYYSQTKLSLLLRKRQDPHVEYLDEDYQALVRHA